MMGPSLSPAATAFAEAVRALDRTLADSRSQWDDAARHSFDRRFADAIQADDAKTASQLRQLARELAAAAQVLESL